ncbi:MAG TPA: LLM class flavin-dependent oxidoreductase [Dehalococcoidia bacterium]|nr:LLM class flavin-dependent oxidoreductase [Dehalococcoidia bacterium]
MERTGTQLGSREDPSPAAMRDFARRAEELGYETVWVGESWGRDAFALITYMATATERLQFGTGIVNVFSRSPALIAQTAATVDELSGGRLILGLGTSGANVIEHWHGLRYEKPVTRMREYIEIVQQILRGERLNYDGAIFHMSRGFPLPFKPLRPSIPIYLATLAGRSLEITGELADGWLPIYFWPEHFDQLTAPIRAGAEKAGRDFSAITITPYILTAVSDDGDEARSLMRAHIAYYVGGMGVYYHRLISGYGFVEEAERIRTAWAERDRARAASYVTDTMVNALTISGTPAQCRERLAVYRAVGVQAPCVSFPHGASERMVGETLEAMAPARMAAS